MGYKTLAQIPKKYAEMLTLFLYDSSFALRLESKAQATHIRHTLHTFRNIYRREAGPVNGSIFDDIDLTIKQDSDGTWLITCDADNWSKQVRDRLREIAREKKDDETP